MEQLKDVELKEILKEFLVTGRSRMKKAAKIAALRQMGINTQEDLENYRQRLNEDPPRLITPPGSPPPKPRKNIRKRKLSPAEDPKPRKIKPRVKADLGE